MPLEKPRPLPPAESNKPKEPKGRKRIRLTKKGLHGKFVLRSDQPQKFKFKPLGPTGIAAGKGITDFSRRQRGKLSRAVVKEGQKTENINPKEIAWLSKQRSKKQESSTKRSRERGRATTRKIQEVDEQSEALDKEEARVAEFLEISHQQILAMKNSVDKTVYENFVKEGARVADLFNSKEKYKAFRSAYHKATFQSIYYALGIKEGDMAALKKVVAGTKIIFLKDVQGRLGQKSSSESVKKATSALINLDKAGGFLSRKIKKKQELPEFVVRQGAHRERWGNAAR